MADHSSVVRRDPVVVQLGRARAALAQANDIAGVKHVLDVAEAGKVYARRQQLGEEVIGQAHALTIDALARLGELLAEMPKNGGAKGIGPIAVPNGNHNTPTLADLGITKKVSMVAQQLAAMPAETRAAIASRETTLTEARRNSNHRERASVPSLPWTTYRVIYADPPWHYGNSGLQQYGHASHHYPSLTIEELCALPVDGLAAQNAVLFLWVTSPLLEASFLVLNAWGFTYKTSFVWDKIKHNFGHYNSVRHELLLVCTRGSCTPDTPTLFDSVQSIERSGRHSEKPQEFRAIIDALYPTGNRIEIFSRAAHDGWDAWGNEPS